MKNFTYIISFLLFITSCANKDNSVKNNVDDTFNQIAKLYNNHQWEELVKIEGIILDQVENDFTYYLVLSESFTATGDINKGIYYAEEWIKKDSTNYTAYLTLGNCYLLSNSFKKAEQCYLKVLDLGPSHARAMLHLAETYIQLNQKDLAINQYLSAIELFSKNGFEEEVIQYSREVLTLDPNNLEAKYYIETK